MAGEKIFCDGHTELSSRVRTIEQKQGERDCGKHAAELKAASDRITGIEKEDADQWVAINQLRQKVWGWTPIMSFLGSVVGAIFVAIAVYLLKVKIGG